MAQLDGKVAWVTGAGSGIGCATAKLLAQEGAKVALLSRTREQLQTVAEEIRHAGGEALVIEGDISNHSDVETAVNQIINEWGQLDMVFANAGVNGVWAPIEQLEPEEFRKTMDINLFGTYLTLYAAVPHLKKQGGAVVITSSINGNRTFSNSGATAYSATKAAQVAMMKMLALELAKHRIRVNAVCPGAIDTQIGENTEQQNVEQAKEPVNFPAGKIPLTDGEPGTSQQVAQLVLFLVSDASRHITGTEVYIDGAESLLQA